jgi:hypothetical protein
MDQPKGHATLVFHSVMYWRREPLETFRVRGKIQQLVEKVLFGYHSRDARRPQFTEAQGKCRFLVAVAPPFAENAQGRRNDDG